MLNTTGVYVYLKYLLNLDNMYLSQSFFEGT